MRVPLPSAQRPTGTVETENSSMGWSWIVFMTFVFLALVLVVALRFAWLLIAMRWEGRGGKTRKAAGMEPGGLGMRVIRRVVTSTPFRGAGHGA